ncbi:MAG: hypothetical protein HY699_03015 [Deltaproteobacteria bacterium]|nr:hypothetical protein [Deltaproteobacteria bacterium]
MLVVVAPVQGLELTGALIYGVRLRGTTGPFWHTASGSGGHPLGITDASPAHIRTAPLANNENGEIDLELRPGRYIFTLLWQCPMADFPPFTALNLYFDGDNLTPGISAVVQLARSFTAFQVDKRPKALSLYLREVDNIGALFFDDSELRAELGVAFYMHTGVPNTPLWRPSDLINMDRVGLHEFSLDKMPDSVLVLELVVGPSQQAASPPTVVVPGTRLRAGDKAQAVQPRLSGDLRPPTAAQPVPGVPSPRPRPEPRAAVKGGQTPTPGAAGAATLGETPAAEATSTTLTPGPERTPQSSATPKASLTPSGGTRTPGGTTAAVSRPTARVSATPAPDATPTPVKARLN